MLLPLHDDLKKESLPYITVSLILVNVLVFAFMWNQHLTGEFMTYEASEANDRVMGFFDTWGLVPKELAAGSVMGLLTNIFIHATIFHLIGNMIVLWAFGPSLESLLGSTSFVVLYVLWGVLASVAQCAVDFSSEVPLVGASGAIAGIIGGYMLMFGYAARIRVFMLIVMIPVRFYMPAAVFGFIWIMSQLWKGSLDITGEMSGIAFMAHIGGFFAGGVMMLIFKNQTDRVLMQNRAGELVFRSREEAADIENQEDANALASTPNATIPEEYLEAQVCSDCGHKLGKENLIADRLMRCPNEECLHLNYLEVGKVNLIAKPVLLLNEDH